MLGIETMITEYRAGTLQVCKAGKAILESLYEIIQKQSQNASEMNEEGKRGQSEDINDKFCDLNDLT